MKTSIALITALTLTAGCSTVQRPTDLLPSDTRRTPAEWEPQAAVWLQWPQSWEGPEVEAVFADIVRVIAQYETVQLLAADAATQSRGEELLAGIDGDIRWHQIANSASWMRDNGPRWVEVDGQIVIQNWEFDGYHLGEGPEVWGDDNDNPDAIAEMLGFPLEHVGLVHERGDLEVNGSDTAMVNWSVVGHRNPGITRTEATAEFKAALGVERVIYLEGFDPIDITRGHTDGLARFVTEDTILVADTGAALQQAVVEQIREQAPDLTIAFADLTPDDPTLNYLVGDGFVLAGTTGDVGRDAAFEATIQGFYPDRAVHFIDVDAIWQNGGAVHCVTNDQPESP